MRTLLIVLALAGTAVAAGASFVLQAGAQEQAATLEYTCDPPRAPSGVDTLLRCRAVATNTGSDPLRDVRFNFEPAANLPPPDRFYFFGGRLDGAPFDVDGGQIVYTIGDLAPGEERVLDLDVIVRVPQQPSGAVARLFLPGDGRELARQLVVIEPDDAPPPVTMRLQLSQNTDDPRRFQALLTANDAAREIDTFTADIALFDHMSIPDAYARVEPLLGEEVFGEKFHLTTLHNDPPSPAAVDVSIAFEVSLQEACQGGSLAIVGYIHAPTGEVSRPALLAELPVPDVCLTPGVDAAGEPGAVMSLGQGGFGPPREQVEPLITLVAMLAAILGFAVVGVGIFVVR
ncbi:MAG: hypothetical protein WEB52_11440 [Dehalococcoidia bacterium]